MAERNDVLNIYVAERRMGTSRNPFNTSLVCYVFNNGFLQRYILSNKSMEDKLVESLSKRYLDGRLIFADSVPAAFAGNRDGEDDISGTVTLADFRRRITKEKPK